jgi:hypothetical protein
MKKHSIVHNDDDNDDGRQTKKRKVSFGVHRGRTSSFEKLVEMFIQS